MDDDIYVIIKRIIPIIIALMFALLIGGCIDTCVSYNERIDNNKHIIDSIKIVNKEYKNKLKY